MGIIKFGSHLSNEFGVRVEKFPDYPVAKRVVERYTVPGRSGTLIIDTGAYENTEKEYSIFFNAKRTDFFEVASRVANWLLSEPGYQRLQDTYDPEVFCFARVSNPNDIRNWMNMYGRMDVKFDCYPQKFLVSGEESISLTSGEVLNNLWMESRPVFSITGNGTLTVNSTTVTVTNNASSTLTLDCVNMDCYTGTTNRNSDVTLSEYPTLVNGENTISFTNTSVSVVPNWWRL